MKNTSKWYPGEIKKLKPKPKEEKEMVHLYERREFPYPGDTEAMDEFIAKGGMIGTTTGPKGLVESDKETYNYYKDLQDKKFDQEAMKLWLRMRNEVVGELQEKGFYIQWCSGVEAAAITEFEVVLRCRQWWCFAVM